MKTLEICVATPESVEAAFAGGADRVELCAGLEVGGLTPSPGLINYAVHMATGASKDGRKRAVHVLVRPRGGDFLYSAVEERVMLEDIIRAVRLGADGIVVGALTAEGNVDRAACQLFAKAAEGHALTFHRAFDLARDAGEALEDIIALGYGHVLTSGQAATAEQGVPLLQRLVAQAAGRISIMPGCGVTPQNATHIIYNTGANELHASARTPLESAMRYRRVGVGMGRAGTDEYARSETSADIVSQLRQAIDALPYSSPA